MASLIDFTHIQQPLCIWRGGVPAACCNARCRAATFHRKIRSLRWPKLAFPPWPPALVPQFSGRRQKFPETSISNQHAGTKGASTTLPPGSNPCRIRETRRHRDTETQRHRDAQRQTQTQRHRQTQTHRDTEKQRDTERHREAQRGTER